MVDLDPDKMHEYLDKLFVLNNVTRTNIIAVVRKNKEPISITYIHKQLNKHNYKIAYKNVSENIKILEREKIIKLEEKKDTIGRHKLVSMTEEGERIIITVLNLKKSLGVS